MSSWDEPEWVPCYSMVYGNTCIDRLTDCPTVSVSFIWYWMLHMPTLPHHVSLVPRHNPKKCHATLMCVVVNSAVCSGDSYKTENAEMPRMGKRKAETPMQHTMKLEWERETSKPLHTCASLSCSHPWLSHMSIFLSGHFTQSLFYISTTHAHCILDKMCTHNAYGHA